MWASCSEVISPICGFLPVRRGISGSIATVQSLSTQHSYQVRRPRQPSKLPVNVYFDGTSRRSTLVGFRKKTNRFAPQNKKDKNVHVKRHWSDSATRSALPLEVHALEDLPAPNKRRLSKPPPAKTSVKFESRPFPPPTPPSTSVAFLPSARSLRP